MLVLSRRLGECINIGDDIVIEVLQMDTGKVKIGITADRSIPVHRNEIYKKIQRQKRSADSIS